MNLGSVRGLDENLSKAGHHNVEMVRIQPWSEWKPMNMEELDYIHTWGRSGSTLTCVGVYLCVVPPQGQLRLLLLQHCASQQIDSSSSFASTCGSFPARWLALHSAGRLPTHTMALG